MSTLVHNLTEGINFYRKELGLSHFSLIHHLLSLNLMLDAERYLEILETSKCYKSELDTIVQLFNLNKARDKRVLNNLLSNNTDTVAVYKCESCEHKFLDMVFTKKTFCDTNCRTTKKSFLPEIPNIPWYDDLVEGLEEHQIDFLEEDYNSLVKECERCKGFKDGSHYRHCKKCLAEIKQIRISNTLKFGGK